MMTIAEQISEHTWDWLEYSQQNKIRSSEETLTEFLAYSFTRFSPQGVRLYQTTKRDEARTGTDLEIHIRVGGVGVCIFAIQAKKLYSNGVYGHLRAKVARTGSLQINILVEYSKLVKATPLYLLYNYVNDEEQIDNSWHCGRGIQKKQLGCTLVPSSRIWDAIEKPGCRNFEWIHMSKNALPWRCLFDCPQVGCRQHFDITEQNQNCKRERWLQYNPVRDESFEWLWRRESMMLSDLDLGEFFKLRNIDRNALMYEDPYSERGKEDSQKEVDLTPRRFLLVKLKEF